VELSPSTVGLLVVVALLAGVASLAVSVVALSGQRKVRRAYQRFSMGSRDDVLTLLERHINEVRALRGDVRAIERYADELRELARGAVSRVGTVRFDAFEDMGGHMSFSSALLDERGDGVVVTAINGRSDTRVYAKPVSGGRSRHNLSREEVAAIETAMSRAGRPGGKPRRGPADREARADAS
jgi:hypothetical protein